MCKFKKILCFWMAAALMAAVPTRPHNAFGLSIKEENELSKEFLKSVYKEMDVIEDTVITEYISGVGRKLVAAMPDQPFPYHFYAVREDAYNAFAGPGGHVFIFSGLFIALDNEDELAALLAHEIAHVFCRHISDMLQKSKKAGMVSMAGMVAGILAGLGGAGALSGALAVGSMAAGQSMALAYTRANELQADQIGRIYLQKAGYSLTGLQSVLKKIRTVDWFSPDEIPTYLRTHPATEDRIIYLDNLLGNQAARSLPRNPAFEKAHVRMTALYGNIENATRDFQNQLAQHPDNGLAHYGYGLVLQRAGNAKTAIPHLKAALDKDPEDPHLKTDLGQACFLAGDYPQALALLLSGPTSSAARNLYLGRTLMALNRYAEAADAFSALTLDNPEHREAFFLLGEAKGKMGDLGEAHYYLGRHYANLDDIRNARFHLNKALEYEKRPDQVEKINNLLKEINTSESFFGKRKNNLTN